MVSLEGHSTVLYKDRLYIFGGVDHQTGLLSNCTWSVKMADVLDFSASAPRKNRGEGETDVKAIDEVTLSLVNCRGHLPPPRCFHACTLRGPFMVVSGGETGSEEDARERRVQQLRQFRSSGLAYTSTEAVSLFDDDDDDVISNPSESDDEDGGFGRPVPRLRQSATMKRISKGSVLYTLNLETLSWSRHHLKYSYESHDGWLLRNQQKLRGLQQQRHTNGASSSSDGLLNGSAFGADPTNLIALNQKIAFRGGVGGAVSRGETGAAGSGESAAAVALAQATDTVLEATGLSFTDMALAAVKHRCHATLLSCPEAIFFLGGYPIERRGGDRGDGSQRRKALLPPVNQKQDENEFSALFPEGTRSIYNGTGGGLLTETTDVTSRRLGARDAQRGRHEEDANAPLPVEPSCFYRLLQITGSVDVKAVDTIGSVPMLWGHSCVRCHNSMIVFGGVDARGGSETNALCVYSLEDKRWRWVDQQLAAAESVGGGGQNNRSPLGSRGDEAIWASSAGPTARALHSAVVHRALMIVHGGFNTNDPTIAPTTLTADGSAAPVNVNSQMNDTWSFSLNTGQWELLSCGGDLPVPRSGHTALMYEDYMVVVGGLEVKRSTPPLFVPPPSSSSRGERPEPDQSRPSASTISVLDLLTLSWRSKLLRTDVPAVDALCLFVPQSANSGGLMLTPFNLNSNNDRLDGSKYADERRAILTESQKGWGSDEPSPARGPLPAEGSYSPSPQPRTSRAQEEPEGLNTMRPVPQDLTETTDMRVRGSIRVHPEDDQYTVMPSSLAHRFAPEYSSTIPSHQQGVGAVYSGEDAANEEVFEMLRKEAAKAEASRRGSPVGAGTTIQESYEPLLRPPHLFTSFSSRPHVPSTSGAAETNKRKEKDKALWSALWENTAETNNNNNNKNNTAELSKSHKNANINPSSSRLSFREFTTPLKASIPVLLHAGEAEELDDDELPQRAASTGRVRNAQHSRRALSPTPSAYSLSTAVSNNTASAAPDDERNSRSSTPLDPRERVAKLRAMRSQRKGGGESGTVTPSAASSYPSSPRDQVPPLREEFPRRQQGTHNNNKPPGADEAVIESLLSQIELEDLTHKRMQRYYDDGNTDGEKRKIKKKEEKESGKRLRRRSPAVRDYGSEQDGSSDEEGFKEDEEKNTSHWDGGGPTTPFATNGGGATSRGTSTVTSPTNDAANPLSSSRKRPPPRIMSHSDALGGRATVKGSRAAKESLLMKSHVKEDDTKTNDSAPRRHSPERVGWNSSTATVSPGVTKSRASTPKTLTRAVPQKIVRPRTSSPSSSTASQTPLPITHNTKTKSDQQKNGKDYTGDRSPKKRGTSPLRTNARRKASMVAKVKNGGAELKRGGGRGRRGREGEPDLLSEVDFGSGSSENFSDASTPTDAYLAAHGLGASDTSDTDGAGDAARSAARILAEELAKLQKLQAQQQQKQSELQRRQQELMERLSPKSARAMGSIITPRPGHLDQAQQPDENVSRESVKGDADTTPPTKTKHERDDRQTLPPASSAKHLENSSTIGNTHSSFSSSVQPAVSERRGHATSASQHKVSPSVPFPAIGANLYNPYRVARGASPNHRSHLHPAASPQPPSFDTSALYPYTTPQNYRSPADPAPHLKLMSGVTEDPYLRHTIYYPQTQPSPESWGDHHHPQPQEMYAYHDDRREGIDLRSGIGISHPEYMYDHLRTSGGAAPREHFPHQYQNSAPSVASVSGHPLHSNSGLAPARWIGQTPTQRHVIEHLPREEHINSASASVVPGQGMRPYRPPQVAAQDRAGTSQNYSQKGQESDRGHLHFRSAPHLKTVPSHPAANRGGTPSVPWHNKVEANGGGREDVQVSSPRKEDDDDDALVRARHQFLSSFRA